MPLAELIDLALNVSDEHCDEAWDLLIRRYQSLIWNCLRKFKMSQQEREDLFQEACLKLFKGLQSYQPERGRFEPWLMKLVFNLVYDHFRRKQPDDIEVDIDTTPALTVTPTHKNPERELLLKIWVHEVLQQETEPWEGMLIWLVDGWGFTYRESAEIMRLPDNKVRNGLAAIRARLRERSKRDM